jgi:hypothetical protein
MSPMLKTSPAVRPLLSRALCGAVFIAMLSCGLSRAGSGIAPPPVSAIPASAQMQVMDPFDDALRRIEKIRGLAPRLEAWVVRRAERMV